jgi:putative transposase
MQTDYSIAELCKTLQVTRSGYHAWAGRLPGRRAQANAAFLLLIAQAHRESRQTYGSPRIRNWLQQRGQRCGRRRVARLMRTMGLQSRLRRRFRPMSLTDSNHDLPVAPNRLRDLAAPQQRDAVWVADITYVETAEGWLYVAGVLDRCTRRCVGLGAGRHAGHHAATGGFGDGLATTAAVVHHSDRGVQYASAAYRQRLAQAGVIPSMSRPGNCYDNAAMESFWSSLKRELMHRCQFVT